MTLQQPKNWPLRYRFLFIGVCLALLASLIIALPITRTAVSQLEQQANQAVNTISRQASMQAADAIFSRDLLSLNVILSAIVEHPSIRYGAVYSLNNDTLAEQGLATSEPAQPISIHYQNEVIGLLEISMDHSPLQQAIVRLYVLQAILSILFCMICGSLGWLLGKKLGLQLKYTQQDIEALAEAHDSQPLKSHLNWGELTGLARALAQHKKNQTTDAAMFKALNQFMTPNIHKPASSLHSTHNSNPESQALPQSYAHAATLFIDFVDFSSVQKKLAPQELAALLNQYYFYIHQAAGLYNGTVDKYMGDGVMVLFGIPQQDEKDCFHGICTALLLIGLFKMFNQQRQEQNLEIIDFKLGLHTGTVLASTIGAEDTVSYTAISEDTHSAAQLCRHSQANRLLLSQQVIDQGRLGGMVILNKSQCIKISQSHEPIESYWVDNLIPSYQALIERQIQHISALKMTQVN